MKAQPVPYASEVVDVASTDHAFALKVAGIYCNAAGDVVAKLRGDSAARTWKVQQYQVLRGDFEEVVKVGTTLTTAGDMIGLAEYRGS